MINKDSFLSFEVGMAGNYVCQGSRGVENDWELKKLVLARVQSTIPLLPIKIRLWSFICLGGPIVASCKLTHDRFFLSFKKCPPKPTNQTHYIQELKVPRLQKLKLE